MEWFDMHVVKKNGGSVDEIYMYECSQLVKCALQAGLSQSLAPSSKLCQNWLHH